MPPMAASTKPSKVVPSVTNSECHNRPPSAINVFITMPGPGNT